MPFQTKKKLLKVIQKIFHSFDLCYWSFIIISLLEEMFFSVCVLFRFLFWILLVQVVENKYGCRVVQLAIELLSEAKLEHISFENIAEAEMREKLLGKIMEKLIDNCERLSSNEFANYVIQVRWTNECTQICFVSIVACYNRFFSR